MEPPMNWKYEVIIYWSNDNASFIAEVPELPGCIAHGATQSDALNSANEAIELWLATAQGLGRAVPEPKGRRLLYA
jgi:predicted RNase H-like HicB family nuclease